MIAKLVESAGGAQLWFWCAGCETHHAVTVRAYPSMPGPVWQWDQNLEAPTVSPSIRVDLGDGRVCHSFVRAGRFEYCADSTHALAGQSVPLEPLEADLFE